MGGQISLSELEGDDAILKKKKYYPTQCPIVVVKGMGILTINHPKLGTAPK